MASGWDLLTPSEQDTYDECARLHELEDWDDFTATQDARLAAADDWIRERRVYIYDLAEGNVENGNGPGWDVANRRQRYDYLHTAQMGGKPHALCQLPTEAAMDFEGVLISEREMWWIVPSTEYPEQSARRQQCTDELVARRKYVWRLAEGEVPGAKPGWDVSNRRQRYANLQIATKTGSAYEDWKKSHDPTTGEPIGGSSSSGSSSSRQKALSWMSARRGCYESPGGSNCDSRSDGIRTAQDRCVQMGSSGTWLRYEPWCGVWCANALQAAGVHGLSYNMASVEWIEAQAKAARAPFRGWTTDPAKVKGGDLVCLFSPGQHVGMVIDPNGGNPITDEGNTSDTSAKRTRSRSDVIGYALVAYP